MLYVQKSSIASKVGDVNSRGRSVCCFGAYLHPDTFWLMRHEISCRPKEHDYDAFIPLFERIAAQKPGTVAIPIELVPDYAGWALAAFWRDSKFEMKYYEVL